jgi:23S rRNA (uridine2552-2'-O)-methyltransferase
MGKRWIRDRKKDHYYRKAKAEHYRSRAAFKLKQLNKKFKLIRRGYRVLDLGAAPGGWTQAAREIVGEEGCVLGVDLEWIEEFPFDNVLTLQGDFTKKATLLEIKELMPAVDAVISDASPDISGVWDIDQFRSVELCRSVLGICGDVLKPGGTFLVKVFQGEAVNEFMAEVKGSFSYTKTTKPKASRSRSAEVYIVGKGYKKF